MHLYSAWGIMKLKSKAVSFYMWQCLLITIEIHQINSEIKTTQPLLGPYENPSDIPGATYEGVSTDSIPESMWSQQITCIIIMITGSF